MSGVTNTELASAIQQVIARVDAREAQLLAWQNGSPTGGPFGDGRYEITGLLGAVSLVKSPARLAYEIGQLTTAGTGAVAAAEAARDAAQTALGSATTEADRAAAQAAAAGTARDQAQVFRNEAASSEANALAHRNAAAASATAAASGAVAAAEDAAEADTARSAAVLARADTLGFRNEAQIARDQAQAFAASINPATLATKAELAAELAALVDAAPTTLNTLNELAAALGDDPNFATTITSQIAAKADAVHTHAISAVTGLQTALDGKAALSHTHTIAQVTGLQAALDGKISVAGGTFSGTVGSPRYNVGDDAYFEDINAANTVAVRGQQNANVGFINFGPGGNALGSGSGQPLTFRSGGVAFHGSSTYGSARITVSTAAPSGGSSGDIWLRV